jgi:phospholipid transport system substrate-binding protein
MNRCLTLIFFLIVPLLGHARATPQEAQDSLRSAIDKALAIAERAPDRAALEERLVPVLNKQINFAAMTRRAIGPGWRTFKPEQQKEATALFSSLIIRTYCSKFTIGEHPEVSYKSAVTPAAGRVDVSTSIVYKGDRYSVVYRMEKEDGWRTTDVVIEGVSMVANYRSQLDPIFKRGGADAVLSSLQQSKTKTQ